MSTMNVRYSTRREGNDGYVCEEITIDGEAQKPQIYGPMPAHIVPAFIQARRRVIDIIVSEDGGRKVHSGNLDLDNLDLSDVFPTTH